MSRAAVIRRRFEVQGLAVGPDASASARDLAILDFGLQDTGTGGASWALANRGAAPTVSGHLSYVWTIRGAPHAYRRRDLADIATATAPFSEADASKRIFDASSPLNKAGIPILDALVEIAHAMRKVVTEPTVKGDLSHDLAELVDDAYLRFCTVCDATHLYEQPFRLAALQAGLELEPGTSPPVLRRIPTLRPAFYRGSGGDAKPRFDVIRNHLRFLGPTTHKDTAAHLDATLADVKAHWPDDAVEVPVTGRSSAKAPATFLLEDDVATDRSATGGPRVLRLLGPFDPYLQLRDRDLLVPDGAHRKDLWRTLGRPGAIVLDGEVLGTWRPKTTKGPKGPDGATSKLTITIDLWSKDTRPVRRLIDDQAERFAAHREATLDRVLAV